MRWMDRLRPNKKPVQGLATWTDGGSTTKCGIPWSYNNYMTVAVGEGSPYKCGQVLKVKNVSNANPLEILVVVVDQVKGYPPNKLNLHRNAFNALGSSVSVGVIEVIITPTT